MQKVLLFNIYKKKYFIVLYFFIVKLYFYMQEINDNIFEFMVFEKRLEINLFFYNDNYYLICNNFDNLFMIIFIYCFYNFKYELIYCYIYTLVLVFVIFGLFNI